jgi:hypothetical protein
MISTPEAADKKEFDLASFDAVIFSDAGERRQSSRKLHVFAGVVVVLAHAGFWWILQWISRPDMPRNDDDKALLIDFITRAAPAEKLPEPRKPVATARQSHVVGRKTPTRQALSRVEPARSAYEASASSTPGFYNDDGSVHIPAQVLADLEKLRGDERSFDFQQPGLERADALLQHRSPLEYQATRFDKDWRPNQDLLTEMLTRAVEASTKEIRIPIPGDPRHHIVCRISFLAMGGGCGVESNDDYDGVLAGHDDPDTLSPKESLACQAWWEKIITTKTQDEWRQTRRLYEQECRKPLAREEVMPPETIKAPSGP